MGNCGLSMLFLALSCSRAAQYGTSVTEGFYCFIDECYAQHKEER